MKFHPDRTTRERHHGSVRGAVLLEAMLALAVFGTVAIALVDAINSVGKLAIESRTDLQAVRKVQSLLEEYSKRPLIEELDQVFSEDDSDLRYRVVVTPAEVRNEDDLLLNQLFTIHVTAKWRDGSGDRSLSGETLRYAAMYR